MADLSDLQAAQTIKIVGSDSSGVETNPANVDSNGNLNVINPSEGTVIPGTVATKSMLAGGQFNTSLPTLTSTQQSAIQLDSSGRLIVSPTVQGVLSEDHNYGTVGASTLRTASQIGNATGAALFGAGTTSAQVLRVVLPTDQTAIPASQSGTWTVQQGTPPWTIQGDSASGVSKAGNPVQIGGVFNTTQPTVTTGQTVEAQTTARGALIVSTGVDNFNINNISGTISLPTGASTSANQTTEITSLQLIDNPIGSVAAGTAGTSSFLIGGVFNTTLPTLTNTQQSAIQLDSSGRMLVSGISADLAPATQNITVVDSSSSTTSAFNGQAFTTGTPTVGSAASFALTSEETIIVQATGTWTGTLQLEVSMDGGTTWSPRPSRQESTSFVLNSYTGNFTAGVNTSGYTNFRVRATAAITGTAIIRITESLNTSSIFVNNGVRIADNAGSIISSDNNGNSNNQRLHVATPDTTTANSTLGSLNAAATITMSGLSSVGFQLNAGTLIGTLIPELSIDGGTTWLTTVFYDLTGNDTFPSFVFGSSNTLKIVAIVVLGGTSHVRVRVSAYTSGTATSLLRASNATGGGVSSTFGGGSAAFGTVANTSVAIPNNTATLLLAANIARKYAAISNTSGSQLNIQLNTGTGLTATTGYIIPAKSFYEFKGDNLWTGAIYGFMSGGATISVVEGTP